MTGTEAAPHQQAEASGHARLTQVAGDYEEHHHQYVRGWEYLRGIGVDDHELDFVEQAFVDPKGSQNTGQVESAAGLLRGPHARSNTLVLCGEAGTGRRTTALRVLRQADVPRERIRWLVLDWDRPRTEQIPHTKGYGFVLDLTGFRALPEDFYAGLADYQKDAEASEALLIILADPGSWKPESLTTTPAVRMIRPPSPDVARAHLHHLAADRIDWLNQTPLSGLLTPAAPPGDAARLARLIAQAEVGGEVAVRQEFTDWHDHLKDWFERHSAQDDLRERALLVGSALLEKVPADIVLAAADQLFTKVGGKLPPGGALAGRDLDMRLKAVNACQVDGEAISLDSDRHGLSEALLKYVWQQRPQLRPVLLEWASHISQPHGIAVGHLRRIADCLVRLALLPGGSTVLSVAIAWIEKGRAAHRQLALGIVETMALHPVTGVVVRKQLYDWAQQKSTSEELTKAIAEICSGQLGQLYPRIALTRLRLLASKDDEAAREAVAEAVRTLASTPDQRILVLSEIVNWAESTDTTIRRAGASTFLALTDISSDTLLPLPENPEGADDEEDAQTPDLFARGWRAALREPSTADAAHDRLAAWLDSSKLTDEQVLPMAATVLRGHIGQAGAAGLLVGSSGSSELGRARRLKLLDLLVSAQKPGADTPGADPSPHDDGSPSPT
ncbi:hypothetical protein [Streptomyces profundus]|uniref:hypothetical protein n=1 Tax=Streptomyces profundus TaxID=2867410 RepID=UPI001D164046|nr:hypothetical protein [Streptomyces sp. MA3_2.13]UED88141.1 hypothetical protein K4G22_31320 [Streptomyces sp. MA3_2.13]